MRRYILATIFTASMFLFFSHPALAYFVQADPIITGANEDEIHTIFKAKDFGRLEEIANELRSTKARFTGGCYKLPSFYEGVTIPEVRSDKGFIELLHVMDKWTEQYPSSLTARVAKANVLIDFAWYARGTGYANTVTEKGWILFRTRLNKANELLLAGPEEGHDDCPMRYELMMVVGMALGMEIQDFESLFKDAVALDNGYYGFYLMKLKYLLPRWRGSREEWLAFANKTIARPKMTEGMTMYTRILWKAYWYEEWLPLRTDEGISWDRMKQGFLDIETNYPGSEWNLNIFAAFAYMNEDTPTLYKLLKKIGDKPRMEVWGNMEKFNKARCWANMPEIIAE